jgi:hypothetical protein
MSDKNKSVKVGAGRPSAKVVWPKGRFTREQAYALNPHLCKLTVINHLQANLKGNKSVLVKMKDELGDSKSEKGLGRKPFIYLRRAVRDNAANLHKAKTSPVSVDVSTAAPVTAEPVTA